MAVDNLQNKIRKGKSMLMVDLSFYPESIPKAILDRNKDICAAYLEYGKALMTGMKGKVSALRFGFAQYALLGDQGLEVLASLLKAADSLGFYVLLDAPEILNARLAEYSAEYFFGEHGRFPCDGIVLSAYLGSDIIKPFLHKCKNANKDVFVLVRSANKSASEIQDLQSGSRLVYAAAADYVNRFSSEYIGKCGYSSVGIIVGATSADSIRNLRAKYPKLFIIADGMDLSGGNAKNCSMAFDRFGHGAIVCVGSSVTEAWKNNASEDYISASSAQIEKHNNNLKRYVTIL